MLRWMSFGAFLVVAGCASAPCEGPASACTDQRLLYENDVLQAKLLVAIGDPDGFPLADALLSRAAPGDASGETEFYKGVLLIREQAPPAEILEHLERAAKRQHPHAIALLYKVYSEPYLVSQADADKASAYRTAYSQLDVATSGYPSFEKALSLVSELVAPPPPLTERRTGA